MIKKFFLIFFLVFFNPFVIFAQEKVFINEFLIDPQPQKVEIINIGSQSADISSWIIDDDGGSSSFFTIPENTVLEANSCLVFQENFYLNKSSKDTLRLINKKGDLIDFYSYQSSPGTNISFSRLPDGEGNWATSEPNFGFFNNDKTLCLNQTPTLTPTPVLTLTYSPTLTPTSSQLSLILTPTPTLDLISYDNIFISEVMVNPSADQKEWVEIYNNNDFPVFLSDWYLDDLENAGSSSKKFSLTIEKKEYKAIILETSMFNNNGDQVRLLDFNKNLKDSFEYNNSKQGKTWARESFDNDNFCLQETSFEKENYPCLYPSPAISLTNSINKNKDKKPLRNFLSNSKTNKKIIFNKNQKPQVLGISDIRQPLIKENPWKKFFLKLAFFYSFLTIFLILIKIKNIYASTIKKFFSSLIYSQ